MIEEMYLIRWLRVKNYNIPDAVNYLLQNIQWREENRMDFISASEDWSDMARDFKYHIEGQDRAAQPLLYVSVDELDIRKSVVNGKTERLLRFVDKGLEEAAQIVNTLGKKYKNVTRGQIIINLFGYNLVEHGCLRCIPVILRGILSYETHYPEYVDQLILLNTPSIAQPLINAATALLSESTRRSLKIYGTNKRDNLKILDTMFERDQIPLEIGGTKVYGGQALDYEDDW
ncbi:SEC14-like protein 2 isoform X2 [Folsomia candida]|nr:SEC14-like protein 2 isoform X2 [Folsomia candida]